MRRSSGFLFYGGDFDHSWSSSPFLERLALRVARSPTLGICRLHHPIKIGFSWRWLQSVASLHPSPSWSLQPNHSVNLTRYSSGYRSSCWHQLRRCRLRMKRIGAVIISRFRRLSAPSACTTEHPYCGCVQLPLFRTLASPLQTAVEEPRLLSHLAFYYGCHCIYVIEGSRNPIGPRKQWLPDIQALAPTLSSSNRLLSKKN